MTPSALATLLAHAKSDHDRLYGYPCEHGYHCYCAAQAASTQALLEARAELASPEMFRVRDGNSHETLPTTELLNLLLTQGDVTLDDIRTIAALGPGGSCRVSMGDGDVFVSRLGLDDESDQ